MQARFVILRVLLEAGEGLVTLSETTGADSQPDALIALDRSKIHTVGKSAIQKFLCCLQVHQWQFLHHLMFCKGAEFKQDIVGCTMSIFF